MFSTNNTSDSLFARTNDGGATVENFAIPGGGALLGSPHRYRIDWTEASVVFSIDGVAVHTAALALERPMRPVASDFNAGGASLAVASMRLAPSAAVFTSRVFDAGASVAWGALSFVADRPAGTGLSFRVRSGDTTPPDGTWTTFAPATPGETIPAVARYLQYEATFTGGTASPVLTLVAVGHDSVGRPNGAPTCVDGSDTTAEDTIVTGAVACSDPEVDALAIELVSSASNGFVVLGADGTFAYTPAAHFHGSDSFTFRASDGIDVSDTRTFSITITPVNDPPVAIPDIYEVDEDRTLSVLAPGVLGNDTDPDGDPLSAARVAGPANGTLTSNGNGSFTYRPARDFHGTDSFTYAASDGESSSAATVTITVRPVNDAPTAQGQLYLARAGRTLVVGAPGVLAGARDADGDPLVAIRRSNPRRGTLNLSTDGSFTYRPAAGVLFGFDTFTYVASDGSATSPERTATLLILPF